jgi:hypothetical protein
VRHAGSGRAEVDASADPKPPRTASREHYKVARRSLRALAMAETELRLIAALAMIGERRRPKKG